MKKTLGYLAGAALIAVTLSGCFRTIENVVLQSDGTVSGEFIFALQEQYAEGMGGEDIASQLGGDTSGFQNATVSAYNEDGFVGQKVTFTNEPIASLVSEDLTITLAGDVYTVTGPAPDPSATEGLPAEAMQDAEATLMVTFPGAVTDHNGSLSGTTVTWDLLTMTEAPHAVGSAVGNATLPGSGGGGGIPSWVWIVVAIVVVGGIIYFVNKKKSGASAAAPAEAVLPAPKAPAAAKPAAKKPAAKPKE